MSSSSAHTSKSSLNHYASLTQVNYVTGSICKVCGKTFAEPVTLPCGHSLCDLCCKQLLYTLKNSNTTTSIESQQRPRIRMGLGTYSKVNTFKAVGINIVDNLNQEDRVNPITRVTKDDFTSPSCPSCGAKPSLIPPYKNLALATILKEMENLRNVNKQFKKIIKGKSSKYFDESNYKSISPTPSTTSSGYGHSEDDHYKYGIIDKVKGNERHLREQYRIKDCKILIIGGEGVGKSTLIKSQILNDAFFGDINDDEDSLFSFEREKKKESRKGGLKNMYMLQLDECNNFDMNINNVDGIALVYSVTDRFSLVEATHFYYMLQEADYHDIPICLIALKGDIHANKRKISFSEGLKRSKELKCPFYEVSGRYNKGVNEAFESMVKNIDRQKSKAKCLSA
uniref:small monomeric GTPase n=1 Tax=Parastrongyloides trichosuri TaxID=131310 RepID=A0A0N4ZCE8_PARTI